VPKKHVVKAGDCIASIAFGAGFHPRTIWEHNDNAELRAARRDGNVLLAGDVVQIPDLQVKKASRATDRRHRFRRYGVPEILKVELRRFGKPRAGLPYVLEVDGVELARAETDAEGKIEHFIPPDARKGRLILRGTEILELSFGHLDPVETESGARARLHNLGLLADAGASADDYTQAITRFQVEQKLEPVTGTLDVATQDKLVSVHGR
jgi:hypothetical protein